MIKWLKKQLQKIFTTPLDCDMNAILDRALWEYGEVDNSLIYYKDCLVAGGAITIGEGYIVENCGSYAMGDGSFYVVKSDYGECIIISTEFFLPLSEYREKQLNKVII